MVNNFTIPKICIFFFLFIQTYYLAGQKVNPQNQLLWKIEGNGLKKPSYLFGTMHVKDERVFNLSDSVFIGISQTDIFAAEIDIDRMLAEMIKMLFNKDTTDFLKNKLSKEDYAKLDDRVKDKLGVGLDKINTKETWMLNMFTKEYDHDRSENQRATFLDAYLYGLAKKLKRTTIGLETLNDYSKIEESKNMKTRLETLLDQTERSSSEEEFKTILAIYERGDLKEIDAFRKTFPSDFSHDLLVRNGNMANRMDSILKTNSMFVAMGCAHLPGDSGMIDLLRKKGYKLSPVTAVYSGLEKKYRYTSVDYSWSSYVPSTGAFEVSAPGPIVDFPIPRYEGLEMKMYMSPDIYRNTFFMVLDMNMGRNVSPESEEKMLNTFADGFAGRSYQVVNKKIIEENGKKKMFTLLRTPKGQYYRYVIMLQGPQVLMGAVSGDKKIAMDENSDRFLNSLKFLKGPQTITDPDLMVYKDTLGAYEVTIPKVKLQEYKKMIEGEASTLEMNMKFSNIPYKGNTFFNTWYLYKDGSYIADDSVALESMSGNLSRSPDYQIKNKKEYIFKGKYPAVELLALHKQVTPSRILCLVKGNRAYMFMVVGESEASIVNESADNFINSITLTDFTYTDVGKSIYTPRDSSFKVMVYDEPVVNSSESRYYENNFYDSISTYAFNDPSSSGAYAISKFHTSPYYTFEDPAKFIDSFAVEACDTLEETLYNKRNYTSGTNYVVEYYTKSKKGKIKQVRYYLTNNALFGIVLASLEEDLNSGHAKEFFSSFKVTDDFVPPSEGKGELLLKNLMSEDTLKQEAAKKALNIVTFKKSNIVSLKKALLFDYKDDANYYTVTAKILNNVQRSFKNDYPAFVKEVYMENKNNAKLQCELLSSLSEMKDDSIGFYTFLNLFIDSPPSENKFNSYGINRFSYSKYAEYLIEPYLEKMKDKMYRGDLTYAIGSMSDTSVAIQRMVAEKYEVVESYMTKYIMPAYRTKDTSEVYYAYSLIHLIDLFPKEKKNKWYSEFIKEKDKGIVYETMVLMLKNDLTVDPAVINKYASDIHYQYYLYERLRTFDKLTVFPKDKLIPKNIAIGSLVSYLEEDDGAVQKISIIGEKDIILNGKARKAYLMKFKVEGDKKWYVGMSAPGALEKANTEDYYDNTYSEYSTLSEKSMEVHFEDLVRNLEEFNTEK